MTLDHMSVVRSAALLCMRLLACIEARSKGHDESPVDMNVRSILEVDFGIRNIGSLSANLIITMMIKNGNHCSARTGKLTGILMRGAVAGIPPRIRRRNEMVDPAHIP